MNLQVHLITGPPLNQGMYSTLGRAGSLHQACKVHIWSCRVFTSSMYSTLGRAGSLHQACTVP